VIRLVLADVDGCLTAGEGRPIDLAILSSIAATNAASREDGAVPAVALCTGRPAPYVEVLVQEIAAYRPSLFENGAGLVEMNPYRFRSHPRIDSAVVRRFRSAMDRLDEVLVDTGRATWQPGKSYTATLYPVDGDVHALWLETRALLDDGYYVDAGVECINLMPAGIDKGAGVDWLAAEIGLQLGEIAGVGDADSDLVFLDRVGFSAAPANATPGVRGRVDYVASRPSGEGLLEVIDRIVATNRAASAA
jgi:hydroxymethylpyrimidine pyrophosphatase-like HAD family hydrolase